MTPVTEKGEAKELTRNLRERARRYHEYSKTLNMTAETVKPLKSMVGEKSIDGKSKESKLIAAGIALIAFPDPTISDLVGAGMVAAGLVKQKTKPLTAADVCGEFQKMAKDIAKLKKEIILNK